eukprot:Opistho-2@89557
MTIRGMNKEQQQMQLSLCLYITCMCENMSEGMLLVCMGSSLIAITNAQYLFTHACRYCNWGRDCQDAASRNAAAAASAWGSMAFSLVGVASCLLVGYLKDRLPKKHRASLCISFLSVLVVGLAYLSANAEKMSFNGAIFLLAVCGWGLLGPYSLPGGAFSVDIGGRDLTGTANSLIDSAGALGAFAIMIIKGQMGESWTLIYAVLGIVATFGIFVSCMLWRVDLRRARQETQQQ